MTDLSKKTCVRTHGINQSPNTLLKAPFPTVSDIESSMEALVGAFAWNLESDKVLTLDNGVSALRAVDNAFPFHGSSPVPWFVFLVGQLVSNRLQVPVSLLQAGANLVDGFENGDVVDLYVHFRPVLVEELLDEDNLCSKSLARRVVH